MFFYVEYYSRSIGSLVNQLIDEQARYDDDVFIVETAIEESIPERNTVIIGEDID